MIDDGILLLLNDDGVAEKYDDTWDITLHCESEEEQKETIKILEKNNAKKVEDWNGQASCPFCQKLFGPISVLKTLMKWDMPHCNGCGQKLDWSDYRNDRAGSH